MEGIKEFFRKATVWFTLPHIGIIDVLEMLILAYAIYRIISWVKSTRAWMLVKGIILLLVVCVVAIIFQMNVILWIFQNAIGVGIIAIVIVFQPELRSALEQLGRQNVLQSIFLFEEPKEKNERFSKRSANEIVRAVFELAKTRTGALIVMEKEVVLTDYERTGIQLDSVISSQLLMNVFGHNAPLHDGAVILRNDRIVAATCYLPLSDNLELSKELGTRHRAGIGVSEVSDCITIIVSEETGKVSVASEGYIHRDVSVEELRRWITSGKKKAGEGKSIILWKNRNKKDNKGNKGNKGSKGGANEGKNHS